MAGIPAIFVLQYGILWYNVTNYNYVEGPAVPI